MDNASLYTIKLIRKEHLENEYYSFDFEKPEGFHFEAGQYGVFGFKDKDVEGRKFRAFSLASTDQENMIRIATRVPELHSDFKDKMLSLEPGDLMTMNAPRGAFTYDDHQPAVFIAGGIGITPIRSMLLCKKRIEASLPDTLIYSELESCYPFRKEIETIDGLEIQYAADVAPTQALIRNVADAKANTCFYYLSGSPGFVNGITALLEEEGIDEDHIRHDVFVGY